MKLITHDQNLRYLIGFTGSSGFMILGKKNYFFTDFRYRAIAQNLEKSRTRIPFKFVEMDKNFESNLKKVVGKGKLMEFESAHLTVDKLKHWKKRIKGKKWHPIKKKIEELRLIKDKGEIALMKKSQKINEETLYRTRKLLKKGVSELEIAWQIKAIGHELGSEDISFEPIVGFGPNSAVPHHQNTSKKLKKGDMVLIDMGMKYKGYCSDMTRVFFTDKPKAEQAAVYQAVLDAQMEAIKVLKAGVKISALAKIARESLGDHEPNFKHSLGHGIGLDVHESPGVSTRSKGTLKEGMVVTVEPGVYLDGKFGVRIEDMGRVTKTGYDNFTGAPKDLKNSIVQVHGA